MAIVVFNLTPKPPSSIPFSSSTLNNFSFLLSPSPIFSFTRLNHHPRRNIITNIPFSSSFRNGSNTPSETECPVPPDQLPINEYQNLSTSFPFSWAAGDIVEYCSRLFVTGASFSLLVGLPVAWFGSVRPESEPLKPIIAGFSSGILVVSLAVVRMYLGWAYVGNRLLSATVEYEETGWYDGQMWVKTAEVLARDRLLGSFSVKPLLSRLKYSLLTLAISLFVCVLMFINIDEAQKSPNVTSETSREKAIPGVYNDDSARSFEPDAFCGEPGLP